MNFSTPTFTISLDLELLWGALDRPDWQRFRPICATERAEVIDRLLELFGEYEVPATWCTVGSLFLDHCGSRCPHIHADLAAVLHARPLVDKIRECRVRQEIGCHSFSHVVFRNCSRTKADQEISRCVYIARALGIEMKSFAFPGNRGGHFEVLRKHGFSAFRGPGPRWYDGRRSTLGSARQLWDILAASEPPVVQPQMTTAGLCNIPGSMLYAPSMGALQAMPVWLRVLRARKGLYGAVRERRIFHLWFQPTDLVLRMDEMFDGLRQILETAAKLRDAGDLSIQPMGEIADDFMGSAPNRFQVVHAASGY